MFTEYLELLKTYSNGLKNPSKDIWIDPCPYNPSNKNPTQKNWRGHKL